MLALLRGICLSLPEAFEKIAWNAASPGAQEALAGADPERFFVRPGEGGR